MELRIDDGYLRCLRDAALEAGEVHREYRDGHNPVEHKGAADLVTAADRAADDAVRERIAASYPAHALVTEEGASGAVGEAEHTWVVDPIDGTTNYAHGLPLFCVSIALFEGTTPAVGGVYAPELDRFYYAVRGEGAYRNDEPIGVSGATDAAAGYYAMDVTRRTDSHRTLLPAFERFTAETHGVVQLMSAALALSFVADGSLEAALARDLRAWDFAAGLLLVREAGGRVTDYDGREGWDALRGGHLVASNGAVHDAVLDRYREALS